ncbi:protein of unknown function [Moritella yayanosii]|uniref:Uncharacterized protein n=1 Tax=Moritella yayanosii TaxID=69539 RepID=A0A330LU38_9GAMM|nr:protein of unknown function [Moritella yayanosii]
MVNSLTTNYIPQLCQDAISETSWNISTRHNLNVRKEGTEVINEPVQSTTR